MPLDYIVGSIVGAAGLIWWAWMVLLGNADMCPGCKRTLETCSCVDITLNPLPFLVYDPATMAVLSEHDTQEAAQAQADLLGAEVLVLDE